MMPAGPAGVGIDVVRGYVLAASCVRKAGRRPAPKS